MTVLLLTVSFVVLGAYTKMVKLHTLSFDNRFDTVLNYIKSGHAELARMATIKLVRVAKRKMWLIETNNR